MPVSAKMKSYATGSSFIRKMFEEGIRLAQQYGPENVYDFSIGNPDLAPPAKVLESMQHHAATMHHGYMPNAGYADVRAKVAAFASGLYEVDLLPDDIIMTCGAGGALNVVIKAILDAGDEVIALAPYFVEYRFYVENHGGSLKVVPPTADFLPDADTIAQAITPRTKAIIINSPNNPTGRVYPEKTLQDLAQIIKDRPDILVISDEPYRRLVYDGITVPSVLKAIPNSVVVTSASKELSLPGQRIGYIAPAPTVSEKAAMLNAMIMANRILGFVNAPALMQKVLADCITTSVDVGIYARRRAAMIRILDGAGMDYAPMEGTFYAFARVPGGDDLDFCRRLVGERILAVPGTGFGCPGYVRFAYCVDESKIAAAAQGLKKTAEQTRIAPENTGQC